MSNAANLIANYAKNNVVLFSILKKNNYPLYRYFSNNYKVVMGHLRANNIKALNDLTSMNDENKIKLYLQYLFGDEVIMTVLRKKERTIYNYLMKLGKPGEVVQKMGFKTEYYYDRTNDYIISALEVIATNKQIKTISDMELYNKINYRAKKQNMTIENYLETLGFKYRYFDTGTLLELREKGHSFNEIALIMGYSKGKVHKEYKKLKGD